MEKVTVEQGDVLAATADVLVLKYAQAFYGVDAAVARTLEDVHPRADMKPRPGSYVILPTRGRIASPLALFVGVVDLVRFDYGQIRSFAYLSLQAVASDLPNAREVVMTAHGPGYGLDEREAFLALLAGVRDAFADRSFPPALHRLRIVEINPGRARRLTGTLNDLGDALGAPKRDIKQTVSFASLEAGTASSRKPHVFVAMPFVEGEMEDVYGFGIQSAVNAAGYLCERIDFTAFTGDVVTRVKDRIDGAAFVVADLTGANANVYLEIGYAWGRGRPTILIAKKGTDLKFDAQGQRCLFYSNITDLSKKLGAELNDLASP